MASLAWRRVATHPQDLTSLIRLALRLQRLKPILTQLTIDLVTHVLPSENSNETPEATAASDLRGRREEEIERLKGCMLTRSPSLDVYLQRLDKQRPGSQGASSQGAGSQGTGTQQQGGSPGTDRSRQQWQSQYDQWYQQLLASQELVAQRAASITPMTYDPELPISARRDEIVELIRARQVIVVCGETGSGKSTQLPKICMEAGLGRRGIIGHTQPRRWLPAPWRRAWRKSSVHALVIAWASRSALPIRPHRRRLSN